MRERRERLAKLSLMLGDALLINVAFALAWWLRYRQQFLATVGPALQPGHDASAPAHLQD